MKIGTLNMNGWWRWAVCVLQCWSWKITSGISRYNIIPFHYCFPTCPAAYTRPFDFSLWNAQVMFSMNIYKRRAWDEFLRSCWLVNKGNQSFDIIQVYWKGANWSIRSQTEFCRYESHTRKETVVSTIVVFCINFHSNSFSSITASGYFSIITKKHRA